ncbi:MAG TPA: DNA alkylation repair protein [Fimbriiglobus sp.]|nr:DNA alkylation repair protein [Fimbriiglobus sp.]
MKATEARKKLNGLASPEVAAASARFFKTGPGQYGEGDTFIGVRVPALRKLARECRDLPLTEIEALLHSPVHEERLLALLVLVLGVGKCEDTHRKAVYDFYLSNTGHVNNWDLVDSSAPAIVGGYLKDKSRKPLVGLAKSASLWDRRIAIVATQHFIRLGEFDDTLAISRLLLADREDLIHKATGWMLREVGDRDEAALEAFLDEHGPIMPRTMLRYAIEHFPPERRLGYLGAGRPGQNKRGVQ